MRTTGLVRVWHDAEGWGVIDSPDDASAGSEAYRSSLRITFGGKDEGGAS